MATFVIAYVSVWTAVALYVLWLGAGQRRLQRAIRALEMQFSQSNEAEDSTSKAA